MQCVVCYLKSSGAKMEEATFVLAGQSLCAEHMQAVAVALEALPDVTPH
jgi:hypothetical protein